MTSLLLLTEESQIARTLIKAPTGAAFDFARIAEVVAHAVERRWKGRPCRHCADARTANPAGADQVLAGHWRPTRADCFSGVMAGLLEEFAWFGERVVQIPFDLADFWPA